MMRTPTTILVALAAAVLPWAAWGQTTRPATPRAPGTAAVIPIRGEMDEFTAKVFFRNFAEARQAGATTIILDMQTPGGLVSVGESMASFLRRQKDVHTIAYVSEYAYSAGTMVAVAADEIVMHEFAKIGDAAPIVLAPGGGLVPLPEAERAKAQSPVITEFENNADRYDPVILRAMVEPGLSVYWVQKADGSQRRFVDESTYKSLTEKGEWKPVEMPGLTQPIDGPTTLLTVNGRKAQMIGLASELAPTLSDLAASRNLSIVARFEPGISQSLIALLSSGAVRALLLTVFLTSLYLALHAPGHGFAEVIALVSLVTLVGVPLLTGYAQWWEIIAILMGIVLLAVELFVLPGFGVAGIAGLLLVTVGFLFTFVAPEPGRSPVSLPSMPFTWRGVRTGLTVLVAGLAGSMVLGWWLRRYLPKLPYFNRLILNTTVGGSESAMVGSLTNIDPAEDLPAIGAAGVAMTDLRPGGTARFVDAGGQSHVISVVSDSGFVAHGATVVVREVAGSRIVVRAAPVTPRHAEERT